MATDPVIGWCEYVALPDWGIAALRAKADTGARSSALHVETIEELPRGRVRFDVVLHRKFRRRVRVEARILRRARVRSSNGVYSTRIFVRTRVRIGTIERFVELSLVDRGLMIYRMLLGRTALEGLFVDPHRRHLVGERPVRRRKAKKP
jgi:hypothetical protein